MGGHGPAELNFSLRAGEFRALEWSASGVAAVDRVPVAASAEQIDSGTAGDTTEGDTAVFLHGLSGMADLWHETIMAIDSGSPGGGAGRPRCVAIDQRGHGRSPQTPGRYRATDYLEDLTDLVTEVGGPVRLVGHSMGARIAMIAAARRPRSFSSVVIVDIGPEAWKANIESTTRLLEARPERFEDRDEALAIARVMVGDRGEDAAEAMVDDRLQRTSDGSYVWRATRDALVESVATQRSRNYWRDWEKLSIPAMLVRGGDSKELRPRVVDEMARRNPRVEMVEIAGVGHNVPMLAPEQLGTTIGEFWRRQTEKPAR